MIQETAALCQHLLDHLSVAVLVFDEELRLIYMNHTGENLLELSARQVAGARARDLLLTRDKNLEQDLRRTFHEGQSISEFNLVLEQSMRALTVNVSMMPLYRNETPVAVLVELQQSDRHLQISREQQQLAQQQAARLLVRGLAHEIKNPLGGIRGAAQLLQKELHNPELAEYTRIVIDEADRLQSLLDRIVAPTRRPQKKPISVHQVLERVRHLVKVEVPEGVRIWADYDPSIPPLMGDLDQLIQAVLNIVRNAAQAVASRGNITLRTRIVRQATIYAQRHRLAVRIDIVDDGPGIDPELLGQIFYPLVTGRADGTGLGLSIAQSLIHQHGGLIECTSTPGETVFSILLPLANGDPS